MVNEYYFFWAGPLSQWAKCSFTIDGKRFNTAEQYMMYKKAVHFGDNEITERIMKTSNPRVQKQLGRQVQNFDPEEWASVARGYVFEGNLAKFTQNPALLNVLLSTGDAIIVEASPYDKIWGIGLNEAVAKRTPAEKWPGTNWLGLELMNVREYIINHWNVKS